MHGRERLWSALGLSGYFDAPPVATLTYNNQGEISGATYPAPTGIAGRTVIADVSCYWEGQGVATASNWSPPGTPPLPLVSTILFNGPDGQGPFGDGPRTMSKSTVSLTFQPENGEFIFGWILTSDVTGNNPLCNLIVMVSNVRDAQSGETLYGGFDETTYRPFQLYPQWRDSMAHCRVIRSLHAGMAMYTQNPERHIIYDATGLEIELQNPDHGSTPILYLGWTRAEPSPSGVERGFAAMNRPTNIAVGNSLRAYIEICNQLGADLWWAHPWPSVAVGSRSEGGQLVYARKRGRNVEDPEQVGALIVDDAYIDGFVNEIETYLRPDLKVYSEWANEVWNTSSSYIVHTRIAWAYAYRMIAEQRYGGDGLLWARSGTLQSPAVNQGAPAAGGPNELFAGFSAAASAAIAEAMRSRLGPSSRTVVAVAAGQSNWINRSAVGLAHLWASMPGLFKQLDAVAHAPYRPRSNEVFNDAVLESTDTPSEAWDIVDQEFKFTLPLTNPQSYWVSGSIPNGTSPFNVGTGANNVGRLAAWKYLALDIPGGEYVRRVLPPGWPPAQRRWNLQAITYEGGNHYRPQSADAKVKMFGLVMEPRYSIFNERYMEAVFSPGPKGVTRDPQSESEERLYRPGMVPLGVEPDAEPLHALFTWLITSQEPSYRHGMFWSSQWWNGQQNSPQALGIRRAAERGLGIARN
jgi:hypothetical protein